MRLLLSALAIAGLVSNAAYSFDFKSADNLFKKRGKKGSEFANSTLARKAYSKAFKASLTPEELSYAVTQVCRLDLYRGGMTNQATKDRQVALEECLSDVKRIKSTNSQTFHYYKITAIALRGKLADGLVQRGKWAYKMNRAQGPALKSTEVNGVYKPGFEAGGILRTIAALRSNFEAKKVRLYNPDEALKLINIALTAPKRVYPPYKPKFSGKDYFENFYYKGQSQIEVGVKHSKKDSVEAGISTLKSALRKLSDLEDMEELPSDRLPETRYYQKLMKHLKNKAVKCVSQRDWKECIHS